jgi:hypothetical protein
VERGGGGVAETNLVEIDDGLPEGVQLSVEVAHAHLAKVTRVVFVDICRFYEHCAMLGERASLLVRWWWNPPAIPRPPGCLRLR